MENKTLIWIKDVRKGCQNTIKRNTEKLINEIERGNFETSKFNELFQELRDNEREDSLLYLIEKMLEEEIAKIKEVLK